MNNPKKKLINSNSLDLNNKNNKMILSQTKASLNQCSQVLLEALKIRYSQ